MTDSLLRQAAMSALWALDINDRWHYANDEHGGYPESELCDQTQAAIATLRTALAQQAAPIRCAKPSLSCPNMKDRENDTSMSYEHYDCKVCGGHIALDYDDMR